MPLSKKKLQEHSQNKNWFITNRMLQSGELPVSFLLTGQKSTFSPSRGDSLHRFTWNLAQQRAFESAWSHNISRQSVCGDGNAAQKAENINFLAKSPSRSEPFDRFLQFLGAFTPPVYGKCFEFDVILFAGYGVIAEKPRVCHLARNFPCTL